MADQKPVAKKNTSGPRGDDSPKDPQTKAENKIDQAAPDQTTPTEEDFSEAQRAQRINSPTAQRVGRRGGSKTKTAMPDIAAPPALQESVADWDRQNEDGRTELPKVKDGDMLFRCSDGYVAQPISCGIHNSIAYGDVTPVGYQSDCAACEDQLRNAAESAGKYATV